MEFKSKYEDLLAERDKALDQDDWGTYDRLSETIARMEEKMAQEIRETTTPTCKVCKKSPEEITEYQSNARVEDTTPTDWVRENERFIPGTNKFYCTTCYIKAGMPLF